MKDSVGTRYVPGYDLFKLIVAIILTVILIFLLLRLNQMKYKELEMQATQSALVVTASPQASLPTETLSPALAETEVPPATEAPVTATDVPTEIPATEEATPQETPAPESNESTASTDCPSNPPRVQVGDTVRVLDWLNFRTGPGLNHSNQFVNKPGTELKVIGGPTCTIIPGDPPRAYLWWNVALDEDTDGWSAEAPLNFPNYFLEPVK